MKRVIVSFMSFLLAVTIVFTQFTFLINALSDGYIEELYVLDYEKTSEYGYSQPVWVSENGEKFDSISENDNKFKYNSESLMPSDNKLPSKYSSVENGYATDIKDQGYLGSCWSFSAMAAAESSLLKKGIGNYDLSESHLIWFAHRSFVEVNDSDPTSGDGLTITSPYSAGGNWLRSTFSLARGSGFALEEDFPIYPLQESKNGNFDESSRYESNFYLKEAYAIPTDERDAVKSAIMENGAVMGAYYSHDNYYNRGADGYSYCYTGNTQVTNHQIAIVGWDDNYSYLNFNLSNYTAGNGAWLVKNSYGTDFGDDGYFWISYYDKTIGTFAVEDVVESDFCSKIYQYDGYGYGSSLKARDYYGNQLTTVSGANVFTASENSVIRYVSFYNLTENIDYTVEVYTGVTYGADTPVKNGTLEMTMSGNEKYAGYHMVELTEGVEIKAGESFSVVITFSNDNGIALPVEGQSGIEDAGTYRYYNSEDGQSYYKFGNGNNWSESSGTDYNNVCIKAFSENIKPTVISTPQELVEFSESVNSGNSYEGKVVKLGNDIDMSDISFNPVGNKDNEFNGLFDGDKHVIKNLTLDLNENNVGLFGRVGSKSVIKNLGVENCNIKGVNNVGALVGYSASEKIYSCYATGVVTGSDSCGGLIGKTYATAVEDCFTTCSVNGKTRSGSLAGVSSTGFTDCYVLESDLPVISGSETVSGINESAENDFISGYVAFKLDKGDNNRRCFWTQGENYPVFYKSEADTLYEVYLYCINTGDEYSIYVKTDDDPAKIVEKMNDGYLCYLYTDYSCKKPFNSKITYNRSLFMKIYPDKLTLSENSPLVLEDGYIYGIEEEANTVGDVLGGLLQDNIAVVDVYGNRLSESDIVTTGCRIELLDRHGEVVDEAVSVIFADANCDGWIDNFDFTYILSYINYEITEDDMEPCVYKSLDVNHDGFVDETDSFLIDMATVYIITIEQK